MSEKLVPVSQVPPKRAGKWAREFEAIPLNKAKPYSGDRARAAWVAFHKLTKGGEMTKEEDGKTYELTVRAERIRNIDATVWVYWREAKPHG